MIRSSVLYLFLFGFGAILVGCSDQEKQAEVEVARPVKTLLIEEPDLGGKRQFPGVIDASRRVTRV